MEYPFSMKQTGTAFHDEYLPYCCVPRDRVTAYARVGKKQALNGLFSKNSPDYAAEA